MWALRPEISCHVNERCEDEVCVELSAFGEALLSIATYRAAPPVVGFCRWLHSYTALASLLLARAHPGPVSARVVTRQFLFARTSSTTCRTAVTMESGDSAMPWSASTMTCRPCVDKRTRLACN